MRERWHVAKPEETRAVVANLRPEDVEECRAMYGTDPASFFRIAGWENPNMYAIVDPTGKPLALGGVAPLSVEGVAQIWLIATPELEKHSMEFLKHSKAFIREISKPYNLLYNYVDARNTTHIKWLKWCGFTFISRKEKWGAAGVPFYEFVKVQ